MNISIFIFLLFLLQFLYWIVGRRASKNLKGSQDYFLAGKNVRFFPLMMTFLATQVGGGLVLGASEEAYLYGWQVILYPLGASLGLIILGLGVGRKLASFQVSTVAQIFEVVYRSSSLKKVASLLSVLSLFMILVAQIIASSKFLTTLGLNNTPLFIAFWAIVIVYTVQGGLKAVISTDIVQAAFFSVVFLLCFAFAVNNNPPLAIMQSDPFSLASSKLCGYLFMPLLFMVIEQDMGQRCFAGVSKKTVSRACLWAGIGTMIVCIVPIFLGCLAKKMGLASPSGGSILMEVIIKTTNPWMSAIVACAILAALISTATSLINAISSNLSSDFSLNFLKKLPSLSKVRMLTSLISISAIFFAFYLENIVDVLIQSYELSVSCLFVPIIFALYKKQGNAISAWLAMSLGLLGFCVFRAYPLSIPKEVGSVLLSLAGYLSGEKIFCKLPLLRKG